MLFPITIISGRSYRFIVKQIFLNEALEVYQVSGRNINITVQSSGSLFRDNGPAERKKEWKLIAGELYNKEFLEKIYEAIMMEVDK